MTDNPKKKLIGSSRKKKDKKTDQVKGTGRFVSIVSSKT